MKKTLIALAAVAAATGAMAQSSVTLSGKYAFAYGATTSFTNTKANGFGTTDGDVVFAAVEDLGGGLKVSADLALKLRGRDSAVTATTSGGATTTVSGAASNTVGGRDAKITLMGGFGRLVGGTVEAGNGIIGRASAGAPTIGLDNGVGIDAASNVDWLAYYTPAMSGLVATVQMIDSVGSPAAGGFETASTRLDGTLVGVTYDAGPLSVGVDYTSFGSNSATLPATKDRTRVSASYDLGVAKVGAGFQTKDSTAGGESNKQWMLGVSVPMGAITLGATYANHKGGNGFGLNGVEVDSYEIGANYAFSKRTNLQVAYQNMSSKGTTPVVAGTVTDATAFRVRLMHAF